MAKYGAKCPCFAPFVSEAADGTVTYGMGIRIGKLSVANLTVNLASGQSWGDDDIDEDISEFASGTFALETTDMLDSVASVIYGSQIVDGELIDSVDDEAPFGCVGFYKAVQREGKRYFQAVWFPKTKAILGNDNNNTRGQSIAFSTVPTTFNIYRPTKGQWRYRKTFSAEGDAIAWLENKCNVATAHKISVAKSGTGVCTPSGDKYVVSGGALEIKFSGTPTQLFDNGTDKKSSIASGKYVISNVVADHEIVVVF